MSTPQIPQQPPDDVLDWLRGKTAEDLGAIDVYEPCPACRGAKTVQDEPCPECSASGKCSVPRSYFPEALRYRNAKGHVVEEPVYLVTPREADFLAATDEAVAYVATKKKRKDVDTADKARALIGEVRFENLENTAIVSLCARNRQPPHIRAYKLHVLIDTFDPATINDAFQRLDHLRRFWDVNVGQLTEEQYIAIAAEVARVRNTSPFVVLAPALHGPFITRLATDLQRFRTCKSCSGCKEH